MNGFRPGLNDKEFAGYSILGPLDVHGLWASCLCRVMLFNKAGPPCEFENLVVTQGEAFAFGHWRGFTACGSAAVTINQPNFLAAESSSNDGSMPGLECRFEDQ